MSRIEINGTDIHVEFQVSHFASEGLYFISYQPLSLLVSGHTLNEALEGLDEQAETLLNHWLEKDFLVTALENEGWTIERNEGEGASLKLVATFPHLTLAQRSSSFRGPEEERVH